MDAKSFSRPHLPLAGGEIPGGLSPAPGAGTGLSHGHFLAQKLSILEFLYSLITIVMCLAGSAGILLAFGTLGANFTWTDPRRMNAGSMGCLGQIITMLYLPISFGSFILPIGLTGFFNIPILYAYLIGLILGSGLTAACAFVPLWLVRKKVERLNEE